MGHRVRAVDASLLVVLHTLLQERNLTRTGEVLVMGRPAVSAALGKLRAHFDDELLVRSGRGFVLTPVAQGLVEPVRAAVMAADELLSGRRAFDPSTAEIQFSAAMADYSMAILGSRLAQLLHARAPGCTLHIDVLRSSREELESQLLRRDFLAGPLEFALPGCTQPVFADELVCVVAAGHPDVVDGKLSGRALVGLPRAAVTVAWEDPGALALDSAMRAVGVPDGNLDVEVDRLLDLPYAVTSSRRCAFMPSWLANRYAGPLDLVIVDTPIGRVPIIEAAHWNPRRQQDPAIVWLRQVVEDASCLILADLQG